MKILFTILVLLMFNSCYNCYDEYRTAYGMTSFKGIIKDAYFDAKHRGAPVIILEDGRKIYIAADFLICYANPGDSIIKQRNSLKYTLFSNNIVSNYYPACEDGFIDIDTVISYESFDYTKRNKVLPCQFEKRK